MYDLAIIGGGPAGISAGVYASRKRLKTVFITPNFGGQSAVSDGIENWIGMPKVSGADLAKAMEDHLRAFAGDVLDIKEGEYCKDIVKNQSGSFSVKTSSGEYETKTIIITTGSHRRKLQIPGAGQFENKGITYCASCDGPLFSDKDVVVVGGGNAGFETASQLLSYCKSVTLLQRGLDFRADAVTVKKVLSHPRMKAFSGTEILEIKGDKFVKSIVFKKTDTGEKIELPTEGVFVEIGNMPTTEFAKNAIKLDELGRIPVNPKNQRTSTDGIWAAGDCTDALYHQNNIASGDAVKALEDAYLFLHAGK